MLLSHHDRYFIFTFYLIKEIMHRETLYAVKQSNAFAVLDPVSKLPVSNQMPNGYCLKPLTLALAQAQALAAALTTQTGQSWTIEIAPHPCPLCERKIWAGDLDFCHPTSRERTAWRAGCNVHDFGCGYEVTANSKEAVMAAWNAGRSL